MPSSLSQDPAAAPTYRPSQLLLTAAKLARYIPAIPKYSWFKVPRVVLSSQLCTHVGMSPPTGRPPFPDPICYKRLLPALRCHLLYKACLSQSAGAHLFSVLEHTRRHGENHIWFDLSPQWLEKWLALSDTQRMFVELRFTTHLPWEQMAMS